jgi:glycosyltransferase involved in cell wall biosynthesis
VNKKVLIHSIAFYPDGVSTAYLYNDIALELSKNGFEVIVLSTTPHYNFTSTYQEYGINKKFFGLIYESNYNGIKVIHIPMKKYKSTMLRICGFFYWHLMALFIGLTMKRVHVILSPSPPLTIGLINLMIGFVNKAKTIYNVQEIYPDFLINHGQLKSKIVIGFLKKLERFIYNKSDATVTIDSIFFEKIIKRFNDKSKLSIIPNFVDAELYHEVALFNLPSEFAKVDGYFRLMYAGNIGYAQDWEPLISLACKLKELPIEFFIIGEGVMKDSLIDSVMKNDLKNVKVFPYQSRELLPLLNSSADAHFIFMDPKLDDQGFPSKVYTIMACARPLIVTSRAGASLNNFLSNKNCSLIVAEDDIESKVNQLIKGVEKLMSDSSYRKELGLNGRKVIELEYSKEIVVSKYIELVKSLLPR